MQNVIAGAEQGGLPVVNLHPGELFIAQEPTIITTILGSCVSVCLFCPQQKIGAMCHGVMPERKDAVEDSFRFVDSSIRYMVDILTKGRKICPAAHLVAKLFGGADVLEVSFAMGKKSKTIGALNIESARKALEKQDVPISVEKVGGVHGRKLFFYTHTGEVFIKRLQRSFD